MAVFVCVLGVHVGHQYVRDRKLRRETEVVVLICQCVAKTLEPSHSRWAFKMYDKDGSGSIEIEEMVEIVGNMFELEGLSKVISVSRLELGQFVCQDTATEKATHTFHLLDTNGDGSLNEDEFISGCLHDKTLARLLNAA